MTIVLESGTYELSKDRFSNEEKVHYSPVRRIASPVISTSRWFQIFRDVDVRVGRWEARKGVLPSEFHFGNTIPNGLEGKSTMQRCESTGTTLPTSRRDATLPLRGIFHCHSEEDPNTQPSRNEYEHMESPTVRSPMTPHADLEGNLVSNELGSIRRDLKRKLPCGRTCSGKELRTGDHECTSRVAGSSGLLWAV